MPSGTYQLHLHKQQHKCLHELAFGVDISSSSSNSSNRHELTVYYELMYDAETTITTQPFHLDPCSTYCHILKPPSGLQSVQLHKLRQGDLIRVSPEFTSASPSLRYPEENVSAGVDDKGNPLFISVRFGSHAELGRSSESGRFIYGRYGSYREEIAPHKNFQGKAAWPGILVNLSCYTWITATMQQVGSLKERAVHLGHAEDGSLHAVRVLFRGWDKATLASGQRLAIMQTTGPIISVLPGKFVFGQGGPDYAMFTWKGWATGGPEVRLGDGQEFQLLCYRVFQG